MNCSQMRMLLPSFESDELSDEEREIVGLHLATCLRCRLALESIRALHGQLSLLQTMTVDSEIADRVISRIRRMRDASAHESHADPSEIVRSGATSDGESVPTDLEEGTTGEASPGSADTFYPGWAGLSEP